jgi:pentatricopeptide repeat protein
MPNQDGVSWNSLISGYACYGSLVQSVKVYKLILKDGTVNLNRITFSTMLILSSNQGCADLGRQIRGQIVVSWTTMLTGLAQNGLGREAIDMFREMR